MKRHSIQQSSEYFECDSVKANRAGQENTAIRIEGGIIRLLNQTDHVALLDHDALRITGGARRIHEISEIIRR
ncbi:hypothetical protein D3C78_1591220 [compost metagenome]